MLKGESSQQSAPGCKNVGKLVGKLVSKLVGKLVSKLVGKLVSKLVGTC